MPSKTKGPIPWILVILLSVLASAAWADTTTISPATTLSTPLSLQPFLAAYEEETPVSATTLNTKSSLFIPLHNIQPKEPTSVYWLRTTLHNTLSYDPQLIIKFTNLTWVDIYLFQNDRCVLHKQAGAFRPAQYIAKGDSRFHVNIPLQPGGIYTLLLKVHHTKHYTPVFDFSLQQKDAYTDNIHQRELLDGWMQGAVCIFIIYTLLSWLVSQFRPYLWLLLFITGAGFYSIASAGYFITWFFPAHPTTGWLFNSHFLHLGLFGLYMLILDFWQLPLYNPRLHQFGKVCIAVLITVSITGFCINYFTGNFNLSNNINLCTFVFPFSYATTVLYVCWHRLSRAQRYLYYGIVMFVAAALLVTLSSAIMHERSLLLAPWITNFTILAVFILFATGLKEELRQHEKDKFAALNSLNQFQKQQTILLEAKVEERTKALQQSNEQLATQKTLLAERNTRIETLINELSHRVKNNLQLLYSLISLQLPLVQDESSRNILRGNTARIKAMMLVNARLHHFEERSEINLHEFAAELILHLQQVYDSKKRVHIEQQIPEGILLHAKQTLSIGLILSELLTNSFKYAFNNNEAPAITIKATQGASNILSLTYADNGPGMKVDATNNRTSMGLPLVKDLTRQLEGTVNINTENGLEYVFQFQLQDKQ